MIKNIHLSEVATFCKESLGAVLHNGDVEFFCVNTDTRTLAAGELFVALRGDNFDAHHFLSQAAEKNVCGLVVEKFDETIQLPQLVVSNTLLALGCIAAMNRNAFTGPVLAVTGSSGKTSVKTMLAHILNECGEVLATKGNFNNHIGVPLTLLQIEKKHQFAVIEMGASVIGEIAYLCGLAKPQITMINNVMPAHIEGFGSIEGVAKAKGEIYQQLTANDIAVVNIDDALAKQGANNIPAKTLTVSLINTEADCFARCIELGAEKIRFVVVIKQQSIEIGLNALGEHNIRNALMASTMAFSVGATLENIKNGLEKFSDVAGRMSRHTGANNSVIIDDSYNANPGSVRAAIDVLSTMSGLRILVLGDLAELGKNTEEMHAELGIYAKEKIDAVYTCGKLSRYTSNAFGGSNNLNHFEEHSELVNELKKIIAENTTLLIKGSRSAKMDLVVAALCESGEKH